MTAEADKPQITGADLPDGYLLHHFDTIDGTNAEALRAGAPPRSVYIAGNQSAGRGRHGRDWISPPGNLFATICVSSPSNRNPGQLAFVAGLAVLDGISDLAPDIPLSLKWPNDVLAGGKKVSGILIEAGEEGYAVGIGVNIVDSPPDDRVRYPATSLKECGGNPVDPGVLLAGICGHFDMWVARWTRDGFEPLRAVWLASAHRMGDTIAASTGDDRIEGCFKGLDADGALVLEDSGGTVHLVTAGDVFFPGTG